MSQASRQEKMLNDDLTSLIKQFTIPAIIANLVNTLYNIVDQIFIGHGVGYLGNAATNISFPITTITLAISLLIGVGAASKFNLEMGADHKDTAKKIVGNTFTTLIEVGIILALAIWYFLKPLMIAFGATDAILDYAMTYTSITTIGIPFLLLSAGGNPLIRGDGSAKYSMNAVLVGAILNTILNPIFIFGFGWGIAGSAWATVISQIISGLTILAYIPNFKQVTLERQDFRPSFTILKGIVALGLTPMFNQLAVTAVQIITNNLMKTYGEQSIYGSDIPIAIAGIVQKLNMIFTAIILGLTQGLQPILGFNYGAKHFQRVKDSYWIAIKIAAIVSFIAFFIFELFAPQILQLFGSNKGLYISYGVRYMRLFLITALINGTQIISTTYFSAIGEAKTGAFLALCKQFFFIVPLLILFAMTSGVDYIMIATPLADSLAWLVTAYVIRKNMVLLNEKIKPELI